MNNLTPKHFKLIEGFEFLLSFPDGFSGPTVLLQEKSTKIKYVAKTFPREFIGDEKRILLFKERIRHVMNTSNTFVVSYTKLFEDDENIYLLRPYIEQPNLSEHLMSNFLNTDEAIKLWKNIVQAYSALQLMGITPNPIKPNNIFVVDGDFICITDLYPINYTDINFFLKTTTTEHLKFLAPEIIGASDSIGAPADAWSLGCLLLLMTNYQLPFPTKNLFSMMHYISQQKCVFDASIPQAIRQLVDATVKFNPKDRLPLKDLLGVVPAKRVKSNMLRKGVSPLSCSSAAILGNLGNSGHTTLNSSGSILNPSCCMRIRKSSLKTNQFGSFPSIACYTSLIDTTSQSTLTQRDG